MSQAILINPAPLAESRHCRAQRRPANAPRLRIGRMLACMFCAAFWVTVITLML
ncbi:uncharacterized protein DUF1360 [Novosphingobium taihuense]|uniref:Uncharacterized protein n=1 Tax=Novosphingobium taihuense TaxID=260085 RepID=A0A7W7ET44_9SPHN|nr:hypothetical protein [Novosphingobium taihuense]TWH88197.1 uncharacterized protein DUF1360 [Novosphingobium taihuense]